ncbi:MAG: DUF4335 domain-containing protein [Cyanobium sp.]
MKQTLTYQPHSFGAHTCRLRVEGLPDVSSGQGGTALGIITGWCLDWVGHPQLEGRREHLQALMTTVIPYARHLLSGVPRAMGAEDDSVSIGPDPSGGHHMQLRSSQPDTPPLQLNLDDAELADLVRVLDQCRLDPRIQLPLPVPESLPLPARELRHRVPLRRRLSAPVGGLAALALAAGASALWPTPRPSAGPLDPTQTSSKAPGQPPSTPATPASSPEGPREGQLKRLRTWLISRTPANGTGTSPQAWKLAVNPQGEVVAASPVEGNGGELRSTLGLPQGEVPTNPSGDTLLVRGVVTPSGYWELSPWHGW